MGTIVYTNEHTVPKIHQDIAVKSHDLFPLQSMTFRRGDSLEEEVTCELLISHFLQQHNTQNHQYYTMLYCHEVNNKKTQVQSPVSLKSRTVLKRCFTELIYSRNRRNCAKVSALLALLTFSLLCETRAKVHWAVSQRKHCFALLLDVFLDMKSYLLNCQLSYV